MYNVHINISIQRNGIRNVDNSEKGIRNGYKSVSLLREMSHPLVNDSRKFTTWKERKIRI